MMKKLIRTDFSDRFIERGYKRHFLDQVKRHVKEMDREELIEGEGRLLVYC